MSDEACSPHSWGAAELVEAGGFGEVYSPICKHCGAVKLLVDQRENLRLREAVAIRPINGPSAVRVHDHQTEIFPDT